MKVAFFSSEVYPFAKTGGLADVSGTLPLALAKAGCEVKIFMPLYKNITPEKIYPDFASTSLGKNVEIIFIKNDDYFMRDNLYGTPAGDYPDNLERFSFFCRKSLEVLKKLDFSPDIMHANDWQASLINIYLKIIYKNDKFYKRAKTVLTIHNLAYQGLFEKEKYPITGIDSKYFSSDFLEFFGKINLLKGGIIFSDMVNTVSPTYAKQIQTPDYGCGLDGVLREKREYLCGILNAIDYNVWSPAKDKYIYKTYTSSSLDDKYVNKAKLQKEMGLKVSKKKFLLGMVTRLAEQKGVDILSKAMNSILEKFQVVILGTGDERYHRILKQKAAKHKDSFSLNLKFDEVLAHKIYASSDAFLMPSRFEPCGLSQLISYKYGTVPVVQHTGGLVDTVTDYEEKGGGFVFKEYSSKALAGTIDRAGALYGCSQEWTDLMKKGMRYSFSWTKTAKEYIRMYDKCRSMP